MKKAILIVCVLALIAMASAAMADVTGAKVFLQFKAGWAVGTSTNYNSTVSFGGHATPAVPSPVAVQGGFYNLAVKDGATYTGTDKVAGNTSGYTFTLVVAPSGAVTEHVGDAHENKCYISAWNLNSWSGLTPYALPTDWVVTVAGARVEGGSVTWTAAELLRATGPAAGATGNVGFWFDYGGNHYTDWAAAYGETAGLGSQSFTVTIGAAPPPTPEPGSLLALGSGLMGLAGFAIRRRRA